MGYFHNCTMRVVSMGVMLGLGLALGLPQHKEYKEEESPHNELKQGSNLYNEGPNRDSVVNQVEQEPQFDAVKDNELEPEQRVDVIKRSVEEEVQEGHDATKSNDGHIGLSHKTKNAFSGQTRRLCRSDTCKNGGTCFDNAGDFSCACTDGWEGSRCEDEWAGSQEPQDHKEGTPHHPEAHRSMKTTLDKKPKSEKPKPTGAGDEEDQQDESEDPEDEENIDKLLKEFKEEDADVELDDKPEDPAPKPVKIVTKEALIDMVVEGEKKDKEKMEKKGDKGDNFRGSGGRFNVVRKRKIWKKRWAMPSFEKKTASFRKWSTSSGMVSWGTGSVRQSCNCGNQMDDGLTIKTITSGPRWVRQKRRKVKKIVDMRQDNVKVWVRNMENPKTMTT